MNTVGSKYNNIMIIKQIIQGISRFKLLYFRYIMRRPNTEEFYNAEKSGKKERKDNHQQWQ